MDELVVNFILNGREERIKCNKNDNLSDAIKSYTELTQKSLNDYYFLFDNHAENEELEHQDLKNVLKKNNLADENEIKQTKYIICPNCKNNCEINIKDYKITLNKCSNCNATENIFLDEFKNTQKINESNIFCNYCKTSKCDLNDKQLFFKCLNCNNFLCQSCQLNHETNHCIINYEDLNYICYFHNKTFISYCKNCNKNLCNSCELDHKNHNIINFNNMIINEKENQINLDIIKKKYEEFKNSIKIIIDMLNKVLNNMETYIEINEKIYEDKNEKTNYQILRNKINIKLFNQNIIEDMNKIINENDIVKKIMMVKEIYEKMIFKNKNDYFQRNEIYDNSIANYNYNQGQFIQDNQYQFHNNQINENYNQVQLNENNINNNYNNIQFNENNINNNYNSIQFNDNNVNNNYNSIQFNDNNINNNYNKIQLNENNINNNYNNIQFNENYINKDNNFNQNQQRNFQDINEIDDDFDKNEILIDDKNEKNDVNKIENTLKNNNIINEVDSSNIINENNNNMNKQIMGNSDDKNKDINEIILNYKVLDNRATIFGKDFVKRNNDKCSLYNGEEKIKFDYYIEVKNEIKDNILSLKLVGIKDLIDLSHMFENSSLLSFDDFSKWNTSKVLDMSYMFSNCQYLTNLPDISKWNVSKVINLKFMFNSCKSLTQLPDISKWNISSVINLSYNKHQEYLHSLINRRNINIIQI